ncbi:hypothetical protein TcCL_Unassigned02360 [Trypanosoma cruzi]|nr:hypothetical protein TcCL_Unassigned02360 [Trypanosoma cruzi]
MAVAAPPIPWPGIPSRNPATQHTERDRTATSDCERLQRCAARPPSCGVSSVSGIRRLLPRSHRPSRRLVGATACLKLAASAHAVTQEAPSGKGKRETGSGEWGISIGYPVGRCRHGSDSDKSETYQTSSPQTHTHTHTRISARIYVFMCACARFKRKEGNRVGVANQPGIT